jgi:8-amino-3,8-dideoxy-alpha-D-manno-octulosonate transaminase
MPGFEIIGKEERDAVNEVFDRGGILYRYGFDEVRKGIFKVAEFEEEFARVFGVRYAQAVTSGTAALKVALFALGIRPGDEVITQCHTFVATVEAIMDLGATPVITEVDRTLNMDPRDLERKIMDRTRAIIPVHMLGAPARMDEITRIAGRDNIPILEDAAQAPGGEYRGRRLGTFGAAGAFSFDFGKVITTGEGGMILTDDEKIYLKCREYADHGHEYNPTLPRGDDTRSTWGFNFKMMELQGAFGLAQLRKLDSALRLQRENKRRLKEGIRDLPGIEFREIADPAGDIGDTLVFFLKDARMAQRFAQHLRERGMGTKNLPDAIKWHFAGTWDHMLARAEPYRGKELMGCWPESRDLLQRSIALPVFIKMNDEQITRAIRIIKEALGVAMDRRL